MSSNLNSVQGSDAQHGDVSIVKGALRGADEVKFKLGAMA